VVRLRLAAIPLIGLILAARHPMHTSLAEVRERAGRVEVSIRVFPDDLESAMPGAAGANADSVLAAYVRRAFVVTGRDGQAVPLRWDGTERVGDVLQLRLEGRAAAGLAGAAVSHGLLLERFPDQVNVVRATYDGNTRTLIFLPGDAAKLLP
jgi:hypothetical protein